jgi:hypothetical protein
MRSLAPLIVSLLIVPPAAAQCEIDRLQPSPPLELSVRDQTLAMGPGLAVVSGYGAKVHLFEPSVGGWTQTQVLAIPGDVQLIDPTVALSGRTLAVGMPESGNLEGRVVVFRSNGGSWSVQQVLQASAPLYLELFGRAVSVDGDRLVVGAPMDVVAGPSAGKATLFEYDGGQWNQAIEFAPGGTKPAHFGAAVGVNGTTVAVGSPLEQSVYIYEKVGGAWTFAARFEAPSGASGSGFHFGRCLSLEGDALVVGGSAPSGIGDVQVFERQASGWIPSALLTPSVGEQAKGFGESVSLSGQRILVGSYRMDSPDGIPGAGAAFVFERQGQGWVETELVHFEDAEPGSYLGLEAVLSGNQALVEGNSTKSDSVRLVSLGIERQASLCATTPNSSGASATISADGCDSVIAGSLTLILAGAPPGEIGLFLFSGAGAQTPLGNGWLCLASPFERLAGGAIDANGQLALDVDFTSGGGALLASGGTWHFQAFFRDVGFGAGFGSSDAVALELQP